MGAAAGSAAVGAEAEKREEKLQALRDELKLMKLSAVRKRAREAGVEEERLEGTNDCEDVKGAVIELVVEATRESASVRMALARPHFSALDSSRGSTHPPTRFGALFGNKHCMLSYQWAVQDSVKQIRSLIAARGVPTWMDIDGEQIVPQCADLVPILRRQTLAG